MDGISGVEGAGPVLKSGQLGGASDDPGLVRVRDSIEIRSECGPAPEFSRRGCRLRASNVSSTDSPCCSSGSS